MILVCHKHMQTIKMLEIGSEIVNIIEIVLNSFISNNLTLFEDTRNGLKMTVFWNVVPSSMLDTDRYFRGAYCLHSDEKSLSETSVSIYQNTWCNISEDSHFHNSHCEKLISVKRTGLIVYNIVLLQTKLFSWNTCFFYPRS
jgi:hypothetical protein